jgi:hypothetical protein
MHIFLLTICVLLASVFSVKGEDLPNAIGLVKTVTGDAYIQRNGRNIAAQPGYPLLRGDVLLTGAKGTMGVIL